MFRNSCLSVLLGVLLINVSFAQVVDEKIDWRSHAYKLENGGSPFDSIRISLHMLDRWHQSTQEEKNHLMEELKKVYHSKLTVETLLGPGYGIHRYVIVDNQQFDVLEKKMIGDGSQFFYWNGIPVHEMKFYKFLTSYYEE